MLEIHKLQTLLTEIEADDGASLNDDQLREALRQIHDQFMVSFPILSAGTLIYRATRVTTRPIITSRVSYPPATLVKTRGRLNTDQESIFYGSLDQWLTCLEECRWKAGERFVVSAWLTTERMMLAHAGYSQETYNRLKPSRDLPRFSHVEEDNERNALIRAWQSRVFTRSVPDGREDLYRLPEALKSFLSGELNGAVTGQKRVSGIMYPSIAFYALGDNVALFPEEADTKLKLVEVILLDSVSVETVFNEDGSNKVSKTVRMVDFARPDAKGALVWGQQSQFVFAEGVDASLKPAPRMLPPFLSNTFQAAASTLRSRRLSPRRIKQRRSSYRQ